MKARRRRGDDRLRITLDLTPFVQAMRSVARWVPRAAEALAETFTPAGQLRRARRNIGGMGTDARLYPLLWQSASCTAWLHESCPVPETLGCACKCHGRRVA